MLIYKYITEKYSFLTTMRQSIAGYRPTIKVPKPPIYKKIRPFRFIKQRNNKQTTYSRLIPSKVTKVKTYKVKPV